MNRHNEYLLATTLALGTVASALDYEALASVLALGIMALALALLALLASLVWSIQTLHWY